MGDYQDLSIKKLTELQDYSEGDKLTMLVQGQSVSQDGTVSESALLQHVASIDSKISIPDATKTSKGLVQVGEGIDVNGGIISVPVASADVAGTVKIGDGITIENGTISAASGGVPNPAVNETGKNGNLTAWTECGSRGTAPTIGNYSHTEGSSCIASGDYSHAEGYNCSAMGNYSHAEGYNCVANVTFSHAEGEYSSAEGNSSHVEGSRNHARSGNSHAEGEYTEASAIDAHAEGKYTMASGYYSHAGGEYTLATTRAQTVIGAYSMADADGSANSRSTNAFIIGNGTGSNTDKRSNAHTVAWDGTGWFAGDVTCDSVQGNHDNLYSMRAMGAVVASTPSMEYGTSNSVSVPANAHTLVDVTFGTAKTEAPIVFTSVQHATAGVNLICTVQSVTNQQASLCVTNLGTTDVDNITVDWIAISGR